MTFFSVVLYLALIVFLVSRRMKGRAVTSLRALALLPVILTVVGISELGHGGLNGIDIAVAIGGGAVSLLLGAVRGRTDLIEERDGSPWVRWGRASVVVFAVSILSKLIIDGLGIAAGGTSKGVTSSLTLAFGLMLLGENGILALRLGDRILGPTPVATGSHDRWAE